nr:hypothetical protein [Streptomyces sp. ADI93-02]
MPLTPSLSTPTVSGPAEARSRRARKSGHRWSAPTSVSAPSVIESPSVTTAEEARPVLTLTPVRKYQRSTVAVGSMSVRPVTFPAAT